MSFAFKFATLKCEPAAHIHGIQLQFALMKPAQGEGFVLLKVLVLVVLVLIFAPSYQLE